MSDWTEDQIKQLTKLWNAVPQISAAAIAERMGGFSKNAIVGKAHRLNLPPRPNPIRPLAPGQSYARHPRRQAPKRAVTLAPLASVTSAPENKPGTAEPPPAELAPMPASLPALVVLAPAAEKKVHPCCWPIGHPGTKHFRSCGEDAEPGKPYCADHCSIAYVRPVGQPVRESEGNRSL